jgi:hypothetical protein
MMSWTMKGCRLFWTAAEQRPKAYQPPVDFIGGSLRTVQTTIRFVIDSSVLKQEYFATLLARRTFITTLVVVVEQETAPVVYII